MTTNKCKLPTSLRFTEDDLALIDRAAAEEGRSRSNWLELVAVETARARLSRAPTAPERIAVMIAELKALLMVDGRKGRAKASTGSESPAASTSKRAPAQISPEGMARLQERWSNSRTPEDILEIINTLHGEGKNGREIADELNNIGYVMQNGKPWHRKAVNDKRRERTYKNT